MLACLRRLRNDEAPVKATGTTQLNEMKEHCAMHLLSTRGTVTDSSCRDNMSMPQIITRLLIFM